MSFKDSFTQSLRAQVIRIKNKNYNIIRDLESHYFNNTKSHIEYNVKNNSGYYGKYETSNSQMFVSDSI